MRLQEFLDLYVAATTIIRIVCKQDKNIFFEGYISEIEDYPEIAEIAGELGLWLSSVYADDDVLVIVATY
jgi:hypothetical protein